MVVVAARRRGRAERRTRRKEEEEGSGEGASEAGRLRRRAAARRARFRQRLCGQRARFRLLLPRPPLPPLVQQKHNSPRLFSSAIANAHRSRSRLTQRAPNTRNNQAERKKRKRNNATRFLPPQKPKKKAKWPRRPAASCPSSRWRSPSCWAHPPCLHRPARPCAGAGVGGA